VASLSLIVVVAAQLARAAVVDLTTALIGLGAAIVLFRFKLSSTWLVAGGAVVGLGAHLLGMAH
jgi:chromate transporter